MVFCIDWLGGRDETNKGESWTVVRVWGGTVLSICFLRFNSNFGHR